MKRDWDKLRRYDRARPPGPIESFHTKRPSRRARLRSLKAKHHHPQQITPKPSPMSRLPDVERVLRVIAPTFVAQATFVRHHGHWHCTQAAPAIEWFTRIQHTNLIETWLRRNHYAFQWLSATPACSASNPQAEERPSVPLNGGPSPSLNNDSPAAHTSLTTASRSGLEQDGLANPHCLMAGARAPGLRSEP